MQEGLWKHRHCPPGQCQHRQEQQPTYEQLLEMQEKAGRVAVGLSPRSIDALPHLIEPTGTCSICLGELVSEARILKCRHVFHSECICKWLSEHNKCPVCFLDLRT